MDTASTFHPHYEFLISPDMRCNYIHGMSKKGNCTVLRILYL